jgi:hypothetical protein
MPEVGETAVWYPGWIQQSERYGDRVLVKILRVAKNGITIEVPLDNGGMQQIRVSRDLVKAPAPPPRPYRPRSRPRLVYANPGPNVYRPRTNRRLHVV